MNSTQGPLRRAGGKVITILSIDGGGVRGIIPAVILSALEAQLQVFSSFYSFQNCSAADYHSVLADGVLAKAKRINRHTSMDCRDMI